MFTGIVQGLCPVVSISDEQGIRRLDVALGDIAQDLTTGASVAVNGVCLTVSEVSENKTSFDIIAETLERSNLSAIAVGDKVNIERSFKVGDEIGGHILSGHVAGVVTVVDRVEQQKNRTLTCAVPGEFMPFLMHKGFVALNGASLTISALDREHKTLSVSLIPETLSRTTFGYANSGDKINIEIDAQTQAIVETVRNLMTDRQWREALKLAE